MATKTGELRETLISAIDDLRNGRIDPETANAIAKLAAAVTASLQVELNAVKELRALGIKHITDEVGSLALGETIAKAVR